MQAQTRWALTAQQLRPPLDSAEFKARVIRACGVWCAARLVRPWALGRRNWLFIGSQLAGERAAVVRSLLQSAKLNVHEPWANGTWHKA